MRPESLSAEIQGRELRNEYSQSPEYRQKVEELLARAAEIMRALKEQGFVNEKGYGNEGGVIQKASFDVPAPSLVRYAANKAYDRDLLSPVIQRTTIGIAVTNVRGRIHGPNNMEVHTQVLLLDDEDGNDPLYDPVDEFFEGVWAVPMVLTKDKPYLERHLFKPPTLDERLDNLHGALNTAEAFLLSKIPASND